MSAADGFSRRAVLAGAGATLAVASTSAHGQSSTATQCAGSINAPDGRYDAWSCDGAWSYPVIRYGRAQRFQPPQPVTVAEQRRAPWNAIPSCPQPSGAYLPHDEDCLFLNVWVPATATRNRPVMVYFHGGAYSNGSVADPLNNGAILAAYGDVVVVTVNHRLNALGYLYMPDRFPSSGNNGQIDLICALQWIKRNIDAFGGDPDCVTVFGQSGGGAKIATLMAMPEAAGLFHRAITMSGQQVTASGPINAARRTRAFLSTLGDGIDPETVPIGQLQAALEANDPILGGNVYMGPVLDMRHLSRHPFWPDAAPQSAHIPMLLGNTIMETRAFFPPDSRVMNGLTMDNLPERIATEMRVDLEPHWVVRQFRQRYPQSDPSELFHRIVTAARSWRGQVEEAQARAGTGQRNTFVYQLDFEQAKHADDIGLSFGTLDGSSPARNAMSKHIMDAVIRFARLGHPGWEVYDLISRMVMIFDRVSRLESDPRQWERKIFAAVPYIQPGS